MYRDKTLIPTEAVRLCALGILADGPARYADLAREVRHFAGRIVGPSLDILGPSLELLRYEGLAETETGSEGDGAEALLSITEAGRAELKTLLTSNVRAPIDDVNKLVVALKFRFLHLLAPAERRQQITGLIELCDGELARLSDLNGGVPGSGHLGAWLEHDIGQLEARIAWLEAYRGQV